MTVESSIAVEIKRSVVLRNMGYVGREGVSQDALHEIDEAISSCMPFIKPMVVYEKLPFEVDPREKTVWIKGRYRFKGDYIVRNLEGADWIVVAITTVGRGIDDLCDRCFEQGDYFKGLIYDAIGAAALNNLNRRFWLKLVSEAKREGMGITHRLSPGHNDWHIKDQETVFSVLDGSLIGVELSENYMMKPVKSLSVVYGIGKGIPVSRVDHDCVDCELEGCAFRMMPRGGSHV